MTGGHDRKYRGDKSYVFGATSGARRDDETEQI
jgi:hypothetical protein